MCIGYVVLNKMILSHACFLKIGRHVLLEGTAIPLMKGITPYRPLKVNRSFEGIYHRHLQGRRISRARNQLESR
jgi:hypothetical protein